MSSRKLQQPQGIFNHPTCVCSSPSPCHKSVYFSSDTTTHMQDINGKIGDAQWRLSPAEATALMGSHALSFTLACTTTGAAANGAYNAGLGDRTCAGVGGRQRMFTWDNSYFKVCTATCCSYFDSQRRMYSKTRAPPRALRKSGTLKHWGGTSASECLLFSRGVQDLQVFWGYMGTNL